MQDEQKLEKVLERFYNRYNKYNTKVLKKLGNVVKQFDGISPTNAHIIAQELKIGFDVNELLEELSEISGKSVQDIEVLFDKVAEENVEFAEVYYKAKNKEYIKYEDNTQLQNMVESIKKQTDELFVNLSKSQNVGFVLKDDNGNALYKPLKNVYNDLIDEAVYNIETGVTDYQSAMRSTINQLADSGVKVHEEKIAYESGYNRRIDSTVRQNVLTGIRQINIGVQEEIGKALDANGVEISAHSPCAEDHLHIQGRQFSKKEFDRINGDLERPIGQYNCRHFIFSIILGVNQPSYTKKQLNQMSVESTQKIEYEGKKYTKYEATQVQRKLETAIRQQKDRQIIARASGNKEEIGLAQQKISQLANQYNNFSKAAGLDIYKNRLTVTGYKKVKASIYTKEETKALNTYISSKSISLNEKLRNKIKLTKEENDIVKNLDSALVKTPNYKGNIVRTMIMDNPEGFISQLKVNKEYSTNQYLSFSTKEGYHKEPNIKIYVENSKQAKDLTKINKIGENEALYQRNKKFIVKKIVKRGDIYYVLWEEK